MWNRPLKSALFEGVANDAIVISGCVFLAKYEISKPKVEQKIIDDTIRRCLSDAEALGGGKR